MRKFISILKETPLRETPHKYPGLDGAKGLLILMVVMTHCLPHSMVLYFMYFFHMPLFMALSGFLVKVSTFKEGFSGYGKRMLHRLIIPWVIATIIFLPFRFSSGHNTELGFYDLIYPYYHLWYIPAYLLGAFLCYSILRWRVPVWLLLFLGALVNIIWYNIYRDSQISVGELPLFWLGDKRLFSYLFFFILGFAIRNKLIHFNYKLWPIIILITASFISLVILIFGHYPNWINVWPYLIFNTALVIFVLVFIAPNNWLQNKLLLRLNQKSLGIYLYHPLLQISIYTFILHDRAQKQTSHLTAFLVFLAVISGTLLLVRILRHWKITDKLMLGNLKR